MSSKTKAIKNIIFDIGNVIVRWSPPEVIKRTFPDYGLEVQQRLVEQIFKGETWIHLNLGLLTEADAKHKFLRLVRDLDPKRVDVLFDNVKATQDLIPGMTELLKALSAHQYHLFALTDNVHEIMHYLRLRYDYWQYFRHVTVSAEVGLIKPNKEIFEYTLQTNQLIAHETLFIDDMPQNVDAAKSLGLHTVLFEGRDALEKSLTNLGIRFVA